MIPTQLFLLATGLALIAGMILGWDFAIHNHRKTRRSLETSINDLEAQVASFHDAISEDPQRAWIDMGKRNVLNQIDNTLRTIRITLDPDS